MRKGFGTDKGKAGQVEGINPIKEIWELIEKQNTGGTLDKLFGFESFLGQETEEVSQFDQIISPHLILNMLGYKSDKGLSKKDKLSNIMSDGRHLGYASFCNFFMSADRKLCAKAKAIFTNKNHGTKILEIIFNKASR